MAALLTVGPAQAGEDNGLTAFRSAAELAAYLDARDLQNPPDEECPPEWEVCAGYDGADEVVITGSRIPAPTITNNQEAGVDEGDIVKLWNDTLVILRRGRLFTIDISSGGLRPVDSIDAYPPGVAAEDDWYDEMLVADGWVVVIGYSYERETTEINRFRINRRGRLTFIDSHRLTANDYYSSRNYASRLIGERLVLYSPMSVAYDQDPLEDAPRLSRWRSDDREEGRSLLSASDVHWTPSLIEGEQPETRTIHTIASCDLTAPSLSCRATAVIGPSNRNVYVSPTHAYLWVSQRSRGSGNEPLEGSAVFRIPMDGSAPQMARTWGNPVDQLSFEEDPEAGLLNVLVVGRGFGDGMWNSDFRSGGVALLRLPLARFDDGSAPAQPPDYRILAALPENGRRIQNRFVGANLVYSVSTSWWSSDSQSSQVTVAPLDGSTSASWLMTGGVERIEPMGGDALVVTRSSEGVGFHTINLVAQPNPRGWTPDTPDISHTYTLENARGAETRSHAFFYQPAADIPDGEFGVLGLPFMRDEEGDNGLFDASADMAFLRRGNDRLDLIGTLDSRPDTQTDDGCVASCIDWYGDARPIFIGERIFALLGYELVEGRPEGRIMREIQRANFAPQRSRDRD